MASLTSGQTRFADTFARETGLDPRVIGSWLLAEQSGSAAQYYQNKNYNNWLNIAQTDSGPAGGAHSSVWTNPDTAAKASAEWMRGRGQLASEYGQAAPGIKAILGTHGQGSDAQISAIANSGWASSGYNGGSTLRQLYGEINPSVFQIARRAAVRPAAPRTARAAAAPEAQGPPPFKLFGALGAIGKETQQRNEEEVGPQFEPAKVEPRMPLNYQERVEAGERVPSGISEMFNKPNEPEGINLEDMVNKNWELMSNTFEQESPIRQPQTQEVEPPQNKGFPANGGAGAATWAIHALGKYAESGGQNMGPELNKLENTFGMQGEPWCAMFATTAALHGGASSAVKTASVAMINQWATEGSHGYERGLRPTREAKAGDLLTFGDQHVAFVKERTATGIVTIEGNADGSGGVVQLFHNYNEGKIARPRYP